MDAEGQKPAPFPMFEYGPYHEVVKQVKKDDLADRHYFTAKYVTLFLRTLELGDYSII